MVPLGVIVGRQPHHAVDLGKEIHVVVVPLTVGWRPEAEDEDGEPDFGPLPSRPTVPSIRHSTGRMIRFRSARPAPAANSIGYAGAR